MMHEDKIDQEIDLYIKFQNESSLIYWYPIVKENCPNILMPKTFIIKCSNDEIREMFCKFNIPKRILEEIKKYIEKIGYPCFLRSDQASGKHNFQNTCYVSNEKNIEKHIIALIEEHIIHDIPFSTFVIREFLDLEYEFTAFFGELPIAKERRYFVKDGKVICRHPYWIEDAIRQGLEIKRIKNPDFPIEEYIKKLMRLNKQTPNEIQILTNYATCISQHLKGYWSIDFAKTKSGDWYFIDAARGEISYHISSCLKYNPFFTWEKLRQKDKVVK